MDIFYYVIITFAWALGGFISGVTSMGCSLVALPIISLVMETDNAILISCVCGGIIPIVIMFIHHHGIILHELILLLSASFPGCLAGVYIFSYIPVAILNLLLGILLGLIVIWQLWGKNKAVVICQYRFPALIAGFLGGMVNALVGVPGAILGVYTILRPWNKESMLSMQSSFFAFCSIFTVTLQASRGLYTPSLMYDILYCLPGMALGVLLSIPAQKKLNVQHCRFFLLMLLAASSCMLLYRGI